MGRDYSNCRASELTDLQVSGFVFSWFLENTEKTRASSETFLRLTPQTGWGLTLPRIPPQTPLLYSAVTHPLQGYVRTQKKPNQTPKYPFSWPELESGQNELQSGQFGPQLGKCLKSGQSKFQKLYNIFGIQRFEFKTRIKPHYY